MEKHRIGRARSTEVRSVGVGDSARAHELAREYGLPFLVEFLSDIWLRHSPESEAEGRRYQQEIVEHGELEVISPHSGMPAKSAVSFLILRSIFYRFPSQPEFYVASARTVLGNPLIALFAPREKLLLKWEFDDKPSVDKKHIVELKSILSRSSLRLTPSHRPVAVLIGHRNFAHHLWNELPALERLLSTIPPESAPELLVRREPLGPLRAIYPELSQWKITRPDWRVPPSINDDGRLFVRLGSYRMPLAVRMRIRRFAESVVTPSTRNLISRLHQLAAPTFWISVRSQKPTMANQVDTLARVSARLLREFERCAILFDGFSPPDDWSQCDPDVREFYSTSAESSKREIDVIIETACAMASVGSQQLLVNAGGLGILDSIALAQTASCYLCHVGTVQHKIGWTTDKKGIIHAKRRRIVEQNKVWHHPDWLENAVLPIPVAPTLVRDSPSGENYAVLNPDKFAEFVARHFRSFVGIPTEDCR